MKINAELTDMFEVTLGDNGITFHHSNHRVMIGVKKYYAPTLNELAHKVAVAYPYGLPDKVFEFNTVLVIEFEGCIYKHKTIRTYNRYDKSPDLQLEVDKFRKLYHDDEIKTELIAQDKAEKAEVTRKAKEIEDSANKEKEIKKLKELKEKYPEYF